MQHAWAEVNPDDPTTYLMKVKAPLDIIPKFVEELQNRLSDIDNPSPSNHQKKNKRFQYHPNICSFYNSPDGCTNTNCQREHIDDPDEKARLLELKKIIDESKKLNEPIKSYYALLDDCELETRELNETIQKNFEYHIRQPTDKPKFQENLDFVRRTYMDGHILEELRNQLKYVSRKCYTNSDPKLLEELREIINETANKMEEVTKNEVTVNKVYDNTFNIYQEQFLSSCLYVC